MINFLFKKFIKDWENVRNPKVRDSYGKLAGVVGIVSNVVLCAMKMLVGLISGSIAIVADAVNNLADASSSVITLLGFRLASMPEDEEHPYGHARIEYITGMVVSMIIILVGFELLTASIDKISNPSLITTTPITLILLCVAVLIKFWLFVFYRKIGKTISSSAIKAASTDSISDCLATTLVFVTSLLAYNNLATGLPLDGIAGIIVAAFILYSGAAPAASGPSRRATA